MEIIDWFIKLNFMEIYLKGRFLFVIITILSLLISTIIILYKIKKDNIFYKKICIKIFKCLKEIGFILALGLLFNLLEIKISITLATFFNIAVVLVLIISIYIICGLFYFEKAKDRFVRANLRYLKMLCAGTLLVLCGNGSLYLPEVIVLTWIYFFQDVFFIYIEKNEYESLEVKNEKNELPINYVKQLFEPRKNQLEAIVNYIDSVDDEFQSISINASWGQGKTSFINSLMDSVRTLKDKKIEIIHIDPNVDDNIESMVKQLVYQLQKIMAKRKVYSGRESTLDDYIKLLMTIIADGNIGWISELNRIFKHTEDEELRSLRESLNNDILKLKGNNNEEIRILIVFDDLDRCSEKVISDTLKFFNTVFSLKNFILLFLIDMNKLDLDKDYLSKYIHESFELAKVDNRIIIDYFLDKEIFFGDEYIALLEPKLKSYMVNFLRSDRRYNSYIIDKLLKEIQGIKDKIASNNEDDVEHQNNRLKYLAGCYKGIVDKIRNPRYVKKYLKEFSKLVLEANELWYKDEFRSQSSYSNEDWVELISNIAFVKIYLNDEFEKISFYGDIKRYLDSDNDNSISKYILNIKSVLYIESSKIRVYNIILNDLYLDVNDMDEPSRQKMQKQLENGNLDIEFAFKAFDSIIYNKDMMEKYANVIFNSLINSDDQNEVKEIVIEVLRYFDKKTAHTREIELHVFEKIFEIIYLPNIKFSNAEKNQMNRLIEDIIGHFIFGVGNYLKVLLTIKSINEEAVFSEKEVERLRSYKELTEYLEKNFHVQIDRITDNLNLCVIFKAIEVEFLEKNDDIKSNISAIFTELYNISSVIDYLEKERINVINLEEDKIQIDLEKNIISIDEVKLILEKIKEVSNNKNLKVEPEHILSSFMNMAGIFERSNIDGESAIIDEYIRLHKQLSMKMKFDTDITNILRWNYCIIRAYKCKSDLKKNRDSNIL